MTTIDVGRSRRWAWRAWLATSLAVASIARADHGADPTDELPLSLMIAVAVVVALAALVLRRIRNAKKRRAAERVDELS